jgi:hypothetical protein
VIGGRCWFFFVGEADSRFSGHLLIDPGNEYFSESRVSPYNPQKQLGNQYET